MSEDTKFCITDKTCHNCYKTFSGKSQLYRHLREVHNEYERPNSFYEKNECIYKCLEGCDVSFRFNRDLRHHLNCCHNFNIVETTKQFLNFVEFHDWLVQEQENGAKFIKNRGPVTKDKKVSYYSCNRSGLSKTKTSNRKRQLKKNGTRKINAGCTSYIKLEETDDNCAVTYCDFHYGHKIELDHLPLPAESRAAIVDKLANGAKLLKFDLHKEYVQFDSVQRSDLLTRSDIKSLRYFSKNQKARIAAPEISSKNNKDLENIDSCIISLCKATYIPNNGSDLVDSGKDKLKRYIGRSNNVTDPSLLAKAKCEQVQKVDKELIEEVKTIEVQDEEKTIKEQGENEGEDILTSDGENIEIHYVEDLDDNFPDTKEDVFGHYVAEMLKQLDPTNRESAIVKIKEILQSFLKK